MIERTTEFWRHALRTLDDTGRVVPDGEPVEWTPEFTDGLTAAGLLQPLPPHNSRYCLECDEQEMGEVVFPDDASKDWQWAVFCCPLCGPYPILTCILRRWQVRVSGLMQVIADSLELTTPARELVPDRVWRLGRLFRSGTQWSVWLGLQLFRRDGTGILAIARMPRRTLLLVPGRLPQIPLPAGVVCCSLADVTNWSDGGLRWDQDWLEELLETADGAAAKRARPARRMLRSTDIAAIAAELKAHLRAARDHAEHTRSATGVPALLPRPTQKELAKRLALSEVRISRSLRDPLARELRLLWNLADDLEGVLRFVP